MAETVEVPFIQFENRRGLTRKQLEDDIYLLAFFQRFRHRFEQRLNADVYLFIEGDGETECTTSPLG